MREIVLDTETTGLDPATGDRIVEIGCIELVNLVPTRNTFHKYINPERPMPVDAQAVHGLSDSFLAGQPVFAEIVDALLTFLGDARLVIHNASFDMGFLNAELARLGFPPLPAERAVDTLKIARQRFPGAQCNLDALCRRYGIDNSNRTVHGALLDAQLLAEVYLELRGGRQPGLTLVAERDATTAEPSGRPRALRPPRPHAPTEEELAAHADFLKQLNQPIWLDQ